MSRSLPLFRGRMNRLPYFLWGIPISVAAVVLEPSVERADSLLSLALVGVVGLMLLAAAFSITIRRAHDLDRSGWFTLLLFLPLANLFVGLYLLFARGTRGPNRFGADPLLPDIDEALEA